MDSLALGCITAQGFGVRALPMPLYLSGHAVALVAAEHGRETLDLTASDIPILDLAVADRWADALWLLAQGAAALRLRQGWARDSHRPVPQHQHLAVGAGPTARTATARALSAELARRMAPVGPHAGTLVTGWEHAVPALREVEGGIRCYLLDELAGVTVAGAVLRLAHAPGPLYAVACDLSARSALKQAVHAVLRKFVTASLAQSQHGNGWKAGDTELTDIGEMDYADLPSEPSHDELAAVGADLRRGGLRAFTRTVGPAVGATVACCRIEPATPEPRGPWAPVDVTSMNLRAPVQSSLAYQRNNVRFGRLYHENSKMRRAFGTLPIVDLKEMAVPARRLIGHAYRDFDHARREYALPMGGDLRLLPLDQSIRRRRSWASMAPTALSLAQLAQVLVLAYGTTGTGAAGEGLRLSLRATPSAGGLYSSDMFVLVNRVTGVEPGLYYFHPGRQTLQLVRSDRSLHEVAVQTGYADRVSQAAALVVYVGAFRRNQWKYWERGYRTVLLDCGHLAQSVVTIASALDVVAHPMIAFVDDYFNDLVGVDGIDDAVLYLTLLGPAARPAAATPRGTTPGGTR